jgi:hypothetical protein
MFSTLHTPQDVFAHPLRCLSVPPVVHVPQVEEHWSRKCMRLDVSYTYGPARPDTRIYLPFYFTTPDAVMVGDKWWSI